LFVGAWDSVVIGVREDIKHATSSDGVLVEGDGDIQVSAFQDGQTLVRIYARFAVAIATPLEADGTRAICRHFDDAGGGTRNPRRLAGWAQDPWTLKPFNVLFPAKKALEQTRPMPSR
jgi:hypothetical protein